MEKRDKEELDAEIMKITGKPPHEFYDASASLPCSVRDSLDFYLAFGRLPSMKEAHFIFNVGVSNVINLLFYTTIA